MGAFVEAAKNSMLDALSITHISLHDDDPSTTGANEVTGGSPAYARKAATIMQRRPVRELWMQM